MSKRKARICRKKAEFAVQAKELRHEIRSYLGIETVTGVRVLIRYDVENLSEDTFEKHVMGFCGTAGRCTYLESFPVSDKDHVFSVEYLPGQFDQRADSAEQCAVYQRGRVSCDQNGDNICHRRKRNRG